MTTHEDLCGIIIDAMNDIEKKSITATRMVMGGFIIIITIIVAEKTSELDRIIVQKSGNKKTSGIAVKGKKETGGVINTGKTGLNNKSGIRRRSGSDGRNAAMNALSKCQKMGDGILETTERRKHRRYYRERKTKTSRVQAPTLSSMTSVSVSSVGAVLLQRRYIRQVYSALIRMGAGGPISHTCALRCSPITPTQTKR